MESNPLYDETRELAGRIAACPDDAVGEMGAVIAEQYAARRDVLWTLLNINAAEGEVIDWSHPQLVALHVDLRDRLRGLVEWAEGEGRM